MLVKLAHRTSFSFGYRTVEYDYESVVYGDDFDVRERLNRRESYANLSFYLPGVVAEAVLRRSRIRRYTNSNSPRRRPSGMPGAGRPTPGSSSRRLGRRVRGRIRVGYKKFDVAGRGRAGLSGDRRRLPAFGAAGQALRHPRLLRAGRPVLALVRQSLLHREPAGSRGIDLSLPVPAARLRLFSFGRNTYPAGRGRRAGMRKGSTNSTIHSAGVYFRIVKNTALGIHRQLVGAGTRISTRKMTRGRSLG